MNINSYDDDHQIFRLQWLHWAKLRPELLLQYIKI